MRHADESPAGPVASVAAAAEEAAGADFVPCARASLDDDDYRNASWLRPGMEVVSIEHWNGTEFTDLRARPSEGGIGAPGEPGTTDVIAVDSDQKEWDHPLPYQIEVGDGPSAELMTVVGRNGSNLTVQRSGNATAHGDGARVTYCPRLQRIHLHTDNPGADGRHDAVVAVRGPLHVTYGQPSAEIVDHPAGGRVVSETVSLDGAGDAPTGTISFSLYGPNAGSCDNPVVPPIDVAVTGDGDYSPPPAALPDTSKLVVANYRWIAEYSGDSANAGWRTSCNDPRQWVDQPKAQPKLTNGHATALTVPVGSPVTDLVTLALASGSPQGTLDFRLYGPDNPSCTGSPALSTSVPVAGNVEHASFPLVPNRPGTWGWTAAWAGDVNNEAVAGACGEASQLVTVTKTAPQLSLSTSNSGARIGVSVPALPGSYQPTGLVRFKPYAGPDCGGGELAPESAAPVSQATPPGQATAPAGPGATYTAPSPGPYSFLVHYDGDANNDDVTVCQPVLARNPTAITVAPAGTGPYVSATVSSVTGAVNPGGPVRFRLFAGPGCAGAPLQPESVAAVNAPPPSSASYPVYAKGSYSWQATYDGDAANASATACAPFTATAAAAPPPTPAPTPAPTPVPTVAPSPTPMPSGTPVPGAPTPSPTPASPGAATPTPTPRALV